MTSNAELQVTELLLQELLTAGGCRNLVIPHISSFNAFSTFPFHKISLTHFYHGFCLFYIISLPLTSLKGDLYPLPDPIAMFFQTSI